MNAQNDQIMSDVGDDPPENYSVINEEVSNDRGLNNPILASTEAPNDQPMSDVDSGNDPSENPSAANEELAPSSSAMNTISTNTISMNSRIELLSLPPEVRVLVYRHLLVQDHPISTNWQYSTNSPFPLPSPPILNTCELIRQEAFQVMYAENTFFIGVMHPAVSILNNRQISDIIQNVHYEARLNSTSPHLRRVSFIHLIREFGSPAIIRRALTIIFRVGAYGNNNLLSWFNRGLPRFTNFRTVQFEFVPYSAHTRALRLCPIICNGHEQHFAPVFGPAESFADGRGLLFRPQGFLDSLPPEVAVDWMDYLDGIRLDWNQL
ncbi:hypothetical protein MMC07_005112 [Pseudocyphellaria aurata]|nr:hypothetical protein [Pseudocyphellaria aurata]